MTLLRVIASALAISMVVLGTQGYLVLKASSEAESQALRNWADTRPDGAKQVELFKLCLKKSASTQMQQPRPVLVSPVDKCASQAGGPDLAEALDAAVDSIPIPAPLRWL